MWTISWVNLNCCLSITITNHVHWKLPHRAIGFYRFDWISLCICFSIVHTQFPATIEIRICIYIIAVTLHEVSLPLHYNGITLYTYFCSKFSTPAKGACSSTSLSLVCTPFRFPSSLPSWFNFFLFPCIHRAALWFATSWLAPVSSLLFCIKMCLILLWSF